MTKVNSISREIEFSAAHVLLGHDKCGRMHGHNYRGRVTIEGPMAKTGMVYDYNLISEIVKGFDHVVILPNEPASMKINIEFASAPQIEWGDYRFPASDVIVIPFKHTTAENIAKCLAQHIVGIGIENGYRVVRIVIELWENERSSVVVEAKEGD